MIDFGFSISKSSTINLDSADIDVYKRLCVLEPSASLCMNCGTCGATCTAAPYSEMSVRKLLNAIQRGLDVKPMLSNCMLCGKCQMLCPRGVNTRNVILIISRIYD